MNEIIEDPPRWRDHRDQSNLAERMLGQDLRAVRTPMLLSGPHMARLAACLRPARARRSRVWIVLAASLLLGLATAASAARLKLLPRWLTGAENPQPVETRVAGHKKPQASVPVTRGPQTVPLPGQPASAPREVAAEVAAAQAMIESPSGPGPFGSSKPATRNAIAFPPSSTHRAQIERQPAPSRAAPLLEKPAGLSRERWKTGPIVDPPAAPLPSPNPPVAPPEPPPAALVSSPTLPAALPATGSTTGTSETRPTHVDVAMLEPVRSVPSKAAESAGKPVDEPDAAGFLADALRFLRTDRLPQSALALLDRHAALLEQSPYRHEALLIRAEALLALRRDSDLLRLLDDTALTDVAASRTLLTTRGRLRAAANRCAEAEADFGRVLAEAGRTDKQALLGRASCRERLGDTNGARLDRERYRREFPTP